MKSASRAGAGKRVGRPRKVGRPKNKSMHGDGFIDNVKSGLSKTNKFLRNSKLISTLGNTLGMAGVPYASQVAGVAKSLGYGKKKSVSLINRPSIMGGGSRKVLKF